MMPKVLVWKVRFVLNIFLVNKDIDKEGLEKINRLAEICGFLRMEYQIIYAKDKNETQEIAYCFRNNKNTVIYAVGGDGTVNNVLNGLIGGNALLGIIPIGKNNNIYRSLEHLSDDVVTCNVMKVNDLYCLNMFTTGIGLEDVPTDVLHTEGYYPFLQNNDTKMLLTIDGQKFSTDIVSATICNGKYYDRNICIAGEGDISKSNVSSYIRTYTDQEGIKAHFLDLSYRDLKLFSDREITANVDGEDITDNYFNINPNAGLVRVRKSSKLVKKLNDNH